MKYIMITGIPRSGKSTITDKLNKLNYIDLHDETQPVFPWDYETHNKTDYFIQKIKKQLFKNNNPQINIQGLTGCYYLKTIPFLNNDISKIIILKRNKDLIINEWCRLGSFTRGKAILDLNPNHKCSGLLCSCEELYSEENFTENLIFNKFLSIVDPNAENWDIIYPKYDLNKELSFYENYKIIIGKYYDDYYKQAELYKNKYDNIEILNSDDIINNIDFLLNKII